MKDMIFEFIPLLQEYGQSLEATKQEVEKLQGYNVSEINC